jgi:hypothetical protein
VVVAFRKEAEHLQDLREESPPKKETGSYVENRSLEFSSAERSPPLAAYRLKKSLSKRMERYRMPGDENKARESSRLPALVKLEQREGFESEEQRGRGNGSLLRANHSELLRQIRSKAVTGEGLGEKRSVSYFDFGKDY